MGIMTICHRPLDAHGFAQTAERCFSQGALIPTATSDVLSVTNRFLTKIMKSPIFMC